MINLLYSVIGGLICAGMGVVVTTHHFSYIANRNKELEAENARLSVYVGETDESGFRVGSAFAWRETALEAQKTVIELKAELTALQDIWTKNIEGTLTAELTAERDNLLTKLTTAEDDRRRLTYKVRDLETLISLRDSQIKTMKETHAEVPF